MKGNPPDGANTDGSFERLQEEADGLNRQVFELKTLLRAGRALSNILDSKRLYSVFVGIVREKIEASNLALFVFEKPRNTFRLVETWGLEPGEIRFQKEEGLLWQTLLQNEPFPVTTPGGRLLYKEFFTKNGLEALQSEIWVPLIMLGQPVGLLTAGKKSSGKSFDAFDLGFLKEIAGHASASINTAVLYEQRQMEKEELDKTLCNLSMLYDIGRAMNYIQDLKNLLRYILKQAISIANAEKGSIMLFDPETGRLHVRVLEGLADTEYLEKVNNQEIPTRAFKPGEGVAGKVFETGKPIFINNTSDNSSFVHAGNSFADSIACVPMIVFGDVVGVINVTNKKAPGGFTAEDEELLKAVSDQAGVAINKAQLWEMAVTDSLTGLYIRRFFLAKMNEEMRRAGRYDHAFSVVMADIDHFKKVNDSFGHPAGDHVLKTVANLFHGSLRQVDLVARFGGEEFVMLLPETPKDGANLVAERLRKAVAEQTFEDMPGVTVSMGIATYPEDGNEIDGLIKKADAALYHAKQSGRNKVEVYNDSIPLTPEKNHIIEDPNMKA